MPHSCTQSMLLLTGVTALFSQSLAAEDTYKLFIHEGADSATAENTIKAVLPELAECKTFIIPNDCNDLAAAQIQAEAIYAGVTHLPCLVLQDEQGPYATLNLHQLNAETLTAARQKASSAQRAKLTKERELAARIFLICATLGTQSPSDENLEKTVKECRALIADEHTDIPQKQFIGYRCLYPALMLQYSRAYTGAHSPYSEAKLLQAIEALEEARDLMPTSRLGRLAYDERERLRKARLQAIKFE